MKQLSVTLTLILALFAAQLYAQDTLRNKKNGGYLFTVVKNLDATVVQDQNRTGTCWSFSALSFLESELIRTGKGKINLSEMFIVRMAYIDKAEKYVRMGGNLNFGQGGAFHDIPYVVKKYGIMPEEAYAGLNYGEEKHNHSEMEAMLKAVLDVVVKNPNGTLTTSWRKAFEAILDAYLGKLPENFMYQGKSYTAKTFADFTGLKMDDYAIVTSFTHHPFYESFIFEVADNWAWGSCYNVPLSEMVEVVDNSIDKGFTIAWASDVSEKGFNYREGLAVVPLSEDQIKKQGADNKHFNDAGSVKTGNIFEGPGAEKEITQEMRQLAFDNYQSTDDHGMHITGVVKDQTGKKFYIVKNSWGVKNNDCDGFFYASESYVKYKTMNIMVHKDALPKETKKKLKL
jgi:bleomycin hydrolase